jgi:S1-C subfamily serine protease
VSTWGYPDGYHGFAPLLSSGYLAGVDRVNVSNQKSVARLVINAAFNLGNSGGPLLEIEKGTVIGVVSSKVAPLPPDIESALAALKSDRTIMSFEKTMPDGTKEKKSSSELLEEVLQYMRSQTQLVIGHAVLPSDLKAFLKSNGVDP